MNASSQHCPGSEKLSRTFTEGADAALVAHLRSCAACAAEWDALAALVQIGKEMPVSVPDRGRLDEVRASLLLAARANARPSSRLSGRHVLAALAAAAVVLAGVFAGPLRPRPADDQRGTVQAMGSARFTHAGPPRDEIVRLSEGTIAVEVKHLRSGERFRVLVGENEVEVRGTRFEVTASHDQLREVRVQHGRVEVRPVHGSLAMLGSGERWQASAPAAAAPLERPPAVPAAPPPQQTPPEPPMPAAPPRPHAHAAAPKAAPAASQQAEVAEAPDPLALAFEEGWRALRGGDYARAASAFRRAAVAGEGQPFAEDAWLWYGVSCARAGRRTDAVLALRTFLERYPRSPRAGEASSILGWQFVEAKAFDEAEQAFRAAADDRSPEVRKSARDGLAAIAARRAHQR